MRVLISLLLASLAGSALMGQTVPRPAPEYTWSLASGGQGKLSDYKGKTVILEFVLTTCPHCQKVAQSLQRVQNELGPKGLQVVAVAIDDTNGSRVTQFQRDFSITFPVGYLRDRTTAYQFLQKSFMDRMNMPQVAVIDRQGRIIKQLPGEDAMFNGNTDVNLRKLAVDSMGGAAAAPAPAKKPTSAKPAAAKAPAPAKKS